MKLVCMIGMTLAIFAWRPWNDPASAEPQASSVVRSQRFELLDDEERVRMEMAMRDDQPVIALKDTEGNDRVMIFYQPDASGIYIKDPAGQTRVGLAQFASGGGVAMHGADGSPSAVYVMMNDQARLDIYDDQGTLSHRWPETGDDK